MTGLGTMRAAIAGGALVLWVNCGSCGGNAAIQSSSTKATASVSVPAAAHTDSSPPTSSTAAATPPCPTANALDVLARAAWQVTGGTLEISCAPASFGQAAWVVWGLARDVPPTDLDDDKSLGEDGSDQQRHLAIVSPSGGVIAHRVEDGLQWKQLDYGPTPEFRPLDLDGDGIDELVTLVSQSPGGVFVVTLTLTRLIEDTLVTSAKGFRVSYNDGGAVDEPPGPTNCPGSIAVEKQAKRQVIIIKHGAPTGDESVWLDSCEAAGIERIDMRDGKLVRRR